MNAILDCTKEQKLAIVCALEMISQGSESISKRKSQENMLKKIMGELGLNHSEWSSYIQRLNPSIFQKSLKSLSEMETEFYLVYIFELLYQNGSPTYQEETVAKNTCRNISGISETQFNETMERFINMSNAFK